MAWDPNEHLRALLGEQGSEQDTAFTDVQIQNLLDQTSGDVRRAAYEGWQIKAANYAELINITEGNASREMGDLHAHALLMVKQYSAPGSALTAGRTRVGRIRRRF